MELAQPQFLHNPRANVSTVGYGDDKGAHVIFDDEFVKNEYKSEHEGRAVFDHYYVMEMQWPGDNTKSFKFRFPPTQTKNEYTERFPRQWEAFKNATTQSQDGTPIEVWPPLDKKRVFELKANRIFTVEQIASLTDQTGPNIGLDWRKMRDQAEAFLNPAASSVQVSKLTRENEDMKHEMEAMKQQLAALSGVEPTKKKRGPKPKIITQAA
jgi:hypothetical protein